MAKLLARPFIGGGVRGNLVPPRGLLPPPAISLSAVMRLWIARVRQRRALQELAGLDDHLLCDIGLTRDQASCEAAKWFWQR